MKERCQVEDKTSSQIFRVSKFTCSEQRARLLNNAGNLGNKGGEKPSVLELCVLLLPWPLHMVGGEWTGVLSCALEFCFSKSQTMSLWEAGTERAVTEAEKTELGWLRVVSTKNDGPNDGSTKNDSKHSLEVLRKNTLGFLTENLFCDLPFLILLRIHQTDHFQMLKYAKPHIKN